MSIRRKIIIVGVVIFVGLVGYWLLTNKQINKKPTPSSNTQSASTNQGPTVDDLNNVQINQGTLAINVENYKVVSVVYFENNAWALASVEPKAYQAQASKMILRYDAATTKWAQVTEPVEVFTPSIQPIVPASLYGYLQSQKMILAHTESR